MSEEIKTNKTNVQDKKRNTGIIIAAVAVIILAIILGMGIYNSPSNRIARLLDLGQKYLLEEDYEQAVLAFREAIEIDPKCEQAYLSLADAYVGLEDFDSAQEILAQASELMETTQITEKMEYVAALREEQLKAETVEKADEPKAQEKAETKVEAKETQTVETTTTQKEEVLVAPPMPQEETASAVTPVIQEETASAATLVAQEEVEQTVAPIIPQNETDTDDYVIVWNDKELEAAVRWQIGIASGDIRLSDVRKLTKLDLIGVRGVTDISVLSEFKNLTTLWLFDTSVTDISALSGLTNLTDLLLGGTGITDISALSGLTNLTDLRFSYTGVADISVLSGMTNLTYLDLTGTGVTDISALSGMNHLTELHMGYTNVTDISALSGLTNLTIYR